MLRDHHVELHVIVQLSLVSIGKWAWEQQATRGFRTRGMAPQGPNEGVRVAIMAGNDST